MSDELGTGKQSDFDRHWLEHSKKAMKRYDERIKTLDVLWSKCDSSQDIAAVENLVEIEAHKVRLAFYEDTKSFNSPSDCALIEVQDIRHLIRRAPAADEIF